MPGGDNVEKKKTRVTSFPEVVTKKVDEFLKILFIHKRIQKYTFPPSLTDLERAYILQRCRALGMKARNNRVGEVEEGQLTITKPPPPPPGDRKKVVKAITLSAEAEEMIAKLILQQKLVEAELNETPGSSRGRDRNRKPFNKNEANNKQQRSKKNNFRNDDHPVLTVQGGFTNRLLVEPIANIPKMAEKKKGFQHARKQLPIFKYRNEIVAASWDKDKKVVLIKGGTGCGKTTQVPQYILEEASLRRGKIRIICTMPQRIAAVSSSERVATERGEPLGVTVGYQIRLDSCVSPVTTLLTYCTNGILLRSMTSYDYGILKAVTHIIVDEIHERDEQTEFLLACLRDVLLQFPSICLILMGADMDVDLLMNYFGNEKCSLISVEGQQQDVQICFMEDILTCLNYDGDLNNPWNFDTSQFASPPSLSNCSSRRGSANLEKIEALSKALEEKLLMAVHDEVSGDKAIELIWKFGRKRNAPDFEEFLELVNAKKITINYQHSITQATMLMACALHGDVDWVEQLLSLGAKFNIRMTWENESSYSAKELAQDQDHPEIVELIQQYEFNLSIASTATANRDPGSSMAEEMKERLNLYYKHFGSDDRIDLHLIVKLIQWIHFSTASSESVLVFLPGYEEIVTLKRMLFSDQDLCHYKSLLVFLMHSDMQSGDQQAVFKFPPQDCRKIVLSTSIAQTSLTIEDVKYVIDSGKVMEKTFDSVTGVTHLRSTWISRASANQRAGRAGRVKSGVCFRLYSANKHESFSQFAVPEILRSSLQELCLYTRAFVRREVGILEFFARLPERPAPSVVVQSIVTLVKLGALDEKEQLTKLGIHLLDLPIEPYLGKALLHSVALKCMDPILTIIAIISYCDPFQDPSSCDEKKEAFACKSNFSENSMSDHLAGLKAFQEWEKACLFNESIVHGFCQKNYLSPATFEMVYDIRAQLLGLLRSAGFVQPKGVSDLRCLNDNSDNWALVKGVLSSILYPNICGIDVKEKNLFNGTEDKINLHPSSIVVMDRDGGEMASEWIIYDEMCQADFGKAVRSCTIINDLTVALFCGDVISPQPIHDEEMSGDDDEMDTGGASELSMNYHFDVNNWIRFRGNSETINKVLFLRKRLNAMILWRLQNPNGHDSSQEETLIKGLPRILSVEDYSQGFQMVEGVGQWPKLVAGNLMSAPQSGWSAVAQSEAAKNEIGTNEEDRKVENQN